MDIKMPDVDGIEAARILTQERLAPVLLLSAYSQQDLVQRAQEAGVTSYLVKPFRESDLIPRHRGGPGPLQRVPIPGAGNR